MSVPKDLEKRKLWKENISKAMKGKNIGSKSPCWKERIHKVCPVCSIVFDVKSSLKDQVYCSKKCKGKLQSERIRGENHPMFGKHLSEKTKEKIKQANLGRHLSQTTKDNMSKAHLGTHLSEKTKEKIRQANSGEKHYNWKEKIQKICLICKKGFELIPSKKNRKCCSKKCRGKMYSGKNNPMFGKKRPDLAEWNRQHSGEKHFFFGKKRPDVAKQLMGEKNYNYGKHLSQETKDKLSKAKRGEKSSCYIDGRSYEPYTIEFNKQLKELIRSRDGYKCQKCGCPEIEEGRKLSIHHIDYNKKNCLPKNLITLCKRCNAEVNKNRKKWTKYFQKKAGIEHKEQLCLPIL